MEQDSAHPAAELVTVATLNAFGLREDWPARRGVVRAAFADLKADLIAFQEVLVRPDLDQVREIVSEEYEVVHHSQRLPDGEGVSIASHWPVQAVREVDLHAGSMPMDIPCSALVVEIDRPEPIGRLAFVTPMTDADLTHEWQRERQAVALARALEELVEPTGCHVVLAGDLNATPDSASIRFWTGRQSLDGTSVGYRDAWTASHGTDPGHTFTTLENALTTSAESRRWELELGRRIDYVLVRCVARGPTLDITWCRRLLDRPVQGTWGSDHFAVAAGLSPTTPSGRLTPRPASASPTPAVM